MRRWLPLLLLILLPLQFTWMAAAVYCQHERPQAIAATPAHFGHHEHAHDPAPAGPEVTAQAGGDDGVQSAKLSVDDDCGYCQLTAAKPVQREPLAVPARASPVSPLAIVPRWQTRDPDGLDRPDWRLA